MNFLAHAYLSFEKPKILVGNLISDFVKGAKKLTYEKDVRQGIELHRQIDSYTDSHPATAMAKEYFRPGYRLYSGAITDIVFDHYLAADLLEKDELEPFVQYVYHTLDQHHDHLPENFRLVFSYMKRDNWLFGYSTRAGIERSLMGMVRRAKFLEDHHLAFHLFEEHYSLLRSHFNSFFPDVKHFAKQKLDELGI